MSNDLGLISGLGLTLATEFATVLPYETHGNAGQRNWLKFKLTTT